ncbi:MAG: PAS domain S-box protein, partial [Rhodocyclaceae bacterium]
MNQSARTEGGKVRLGPGGVAIAYTVFAALWILVSDGLLTLLTQDPALLAQLSARKGFFFVAVTGGLLYLLLKSRRGSGLPPETADAGSRPLPQPLRVATLIVLFLGVPFFGLGVIALQRPLQEKDVYGDLRAIADLKAGHIENWLQERKGDAKVLARDAGFAEHVAALQRQPADVSSARLLRARMEALLEFPDYRGLLLLGRDGKVLIAVGRSDAGLDFDASSLARVMASGELRRGQVLVDGPVASKLDLIVPIMAPAGRSDKPVAAVLLRIDPRLFLFPYVIAWPSARSSGETLLVRGEGGAVVFLTPLRHGQEHLPVLGKRVGDTGLPAAVAIRQGSKGILDGVDYRGERVLAAYGPVAGTDWHIVAKLDRREALESVNKMGAWFSAVAFFAALAVAAAMVLVWRQQRRSDAMAMQAQAALLREEGNRRYRALALSAQDAIVSVGVDGVVTGWNPAAERIFGYTEREVKGERWSLLLPPSVREVPTGALLRQLAQRSLDAAAQTIEGTAQRKDGTKFPIELSLGRWESKEGVSYTAVVRDITQRRQNEQALAASARRFRSMIDFSPIPYVLSDHNGLINYVNPAFVDVFGYRREELHDLDSFWQKTLPANSDQSRVTRDWAARMADLRGDAGPLGSLQTQLLCGDGTTRTAILDAVRLGDAGDAVVLTTLVDVTAQTNAAHRLQALFEASSDGIHVLDRHGDIVEFNQTFATMLGYTAEEAERLNVTDWEAAIPSEDVVLAVARLMEAPAAFETRHRRKDGQVFDVEVRTARLMLDGR